MTTRRAILAISTLVIAGVCLDAKVTAAQEANRKTGNITGQVINAQRRPVIGAAVILCDATSGIPISCDAFRTFTEAYLAPRTASSPKRDPEDPILYTTTDAKGTFRFEDIPTGRYRLVAQSWLDVPAIKGLFARNGKRIELHGVAENVRVATHQRTDVTLRPLGSGVLHFDQDLPNDETLLVLSTAPTCADPILGFAGWSGAFMRHALGANRMPAGETTISGLPKGTVYFAMFAADNVPGWTEGRVEITSDHPVKIERIPFVCAWSNGRHEPPEALKPLVQELQALRETGEPPEPNHPLLQMQHLMADDNPKGLFAHQQWLGRHLEHKFRMPSGDEVLLKDLAAASRYAALQRTVARKKQASDKHQQAMNEFRASREEKKADATAQPPTPPALDVTSPESFFPSDPQAAGELDKMWAVKWEAIKTVPEDELLETIRRGLRETTANRKDIIKTIGSKFVWHMSPSHPLAVDILYAATFDPELKGDAFYHGLTTAKPKPAYVLDRLAELALEGYDVYRIIWGTRDQADDFERQLQARLADADDAERHESRNIHRMIEAMEIRVYDAGQGSIELDQLREIREEYTSSLEQIRQTLLSADSTARRSELEQLLAAKIYFLFDDTFVSALEACSDDPDAAVRSQTAQLAGLYWLWGDTMTCPAVTQMLMKLSDDPVPDVRFVAAEKGLFNVPNKSDDILRRIADLALAEKEDLPDKLYLRIGAVLRAHRDQTQAILLACRDEALYPVEAITDLYRTALRADLPAPP